MSPLAAKPACGPRKFAPADVTRTVRFVPQPRALGHRGADRRAPDRVVVAMKRPLRPAGAPAVFLDKDGTLVRDVPFNVDPNRIELMPGVASGLRALFDASYRLCVVSNQPGVAMGLFPKSALREVESRIAELAGEAGASIDGYFFCPHAASARGPGAKLACMCRKPMPGLLLAAAGRIGIDLARSWMIGDILDDVEAGHRAGCRSVLVNSGGETLWQAGSHRTPDAMVSRFDLAVRFILDVDAGDRRESAARGAEAR